MVQIVIVLSMVNPPLFGFIKLQHRMQVKQLFMFNYAVCTLKMYRLNKIPEYVIMLCIDIYIIKPLFVTIYQINDH